jgi:ABC-type sugar transport system substrate-binding protein
MANGKQLLGITGAVALAITAVGATVTAQSPSAPADDKIKLGMVVHVVGNPFIKQIQDYAQIAANDLGVDLQIAGPTGGSPDEQIALIQGFADAGVQGILTSVPGASLAEPLNAIIDGGLPVVQFNLLDKGVKAPYVGEKSTESGRILGAKIVELLGGEGATGKVFIGNCLPGYPVLENRSKGVRESLAKAPGLVVSDDFDVTVQPTTNLSAWEAVLTANPDGVAFIGLCALDIPSLAKLQEANPDTAYVMGGYDLTAENVKALKDGLVDVSLGQTPFMQGYLPVKMLVDTIKGTSTTDLTAGGFLNAGTEIVTKDGVTEPFDLKAITLDELEAINATPAAAREYYQPLVDGVIADWASNLAPIESESE